MTASHSSSSSAISTATASANFTPSISLASYQEIEKYFNQIKNAIQASGNTASGLGSLLQQKLMGQRLHDVLKESDVKNMTMVQFIDAMFKTTKPLVFAESPALIGTTEWTLNEMSMLGRIVRRVENVDVYCKSSYQPTPADMIIDRPAKAHMIYMNGALLSGCGADLERVTTNGKFDRNKFDAFLVENVLPGLQVSDGILTIPVLGGHMFAGKLFAKDLNAYYLEAITKLIESNADLLKQLQCIVITGLPDSTITLPKSNIELVTTKRPVGLYPQDLLKEKYDNKFANLTVCTGVAGDHLSFCGNDAYKNLDSTQEGGTASRTDNLYKMTGVQGSMKPNDAGVLVYSPDSVGTNYEEVCAKQKVTMNFSKLEICHLDGRLEIVPYVKSNAYNPQYLAVQLPAKLENKEASSIQFNAYDKDFMAKRKTVTDLLKPLNHEGGKQAKAYDAFEAFSKSLANPNQQLKAIDDLARATELMTTYLRNIEQAKDTSLLRSNLERELLTCGDIGACLNNSKVIRIRGIIGIFKRTNPQAPKVLNKNVVDIKQFAKAITELNDSVELQILKNKAVDVIKQTLNSNSNVELARIFNDSEGVLVRQPDNTFRVVPLTAADIPKMMNDVNGDHYRYRNATNNQFDWKAIQRELVCTDFLFTKADVYLPTGKDGKALDILSLSLSQTIAIAAKQQSLKSMVEQQYDTIYAKVNKTATASQSNTATASTASTSSATASTASTSTASTAPVANSSSSTASTAPVASSSSSSSSQSHVSEDASKTNTTTIMTRLHGSSSQPIIIQSQTPQQPQPATQQPQPAAQQQAQQQQAQQPERKRGRQANPDAAQKFRGPGPGHSS